MRGGGTYYQTKQLISYKINYFYSEIGYKCYSAILYVYFSYVWHLMVNNYLFQPNTKIIKNTV